MGQFVPLQLVDKFDLVPEGLAEAAVRSSLQAFPQPVPRPWVEYLARDLRSFNLAALNANRLMNSSVRISQTPVAMAMGNFLDFQSVTSVTGMAFQPDQKCPRDLDSLYKWGAQQLFIYGAEQALCLATVAAKLASWSSKMPHRTVVIVDSPLGGTVPAYVLRDALKNQGISAEVREFLAPRLDQHARKYSLKAAAADFCRSLPPGEYPVVFPDEVITGTRFRKLYKALEKHLKNRVVPIALSVHSWNGTSRDSQKLRKLQIELRALGCAKQGAPVFTEFPCAALVKVDEGAPVTLSAPFFWAEHDLAAGKRKVNLIFSLIDQIKTIANDLGSKTGTSIHHLELIWSQSSDGTVITQSQPFLRQIVPRFAVKIDWEAIEEKARIEFKAEYIGVSSPNTLEEVAARLNWVLTAIYDQLCQHCSKPTGAANEAGMVINALRDLYALAHGGRRRPLPRDRDFCESTISLVYPDLAFHEELIRLVLACIPAH